ncbi:MAG: glutamate racemase [Anaerolineae bacterium]|nr:glutamate racemase [Anaerolineae bacterium]
MESGQAIGIFDSGVGGLSVWREVAHLLPAAPLHYLADQRHMPYGTRPFDEIRHFAEEITRFLLGQGARLIVIACNTISAVALHHLRAQFPATSFVGMEPALKPAVERTRSGVVGVIATPVTIEGPLMASLMARYGDGVRVFGQACPGLAEAVEAGQLENVGTRQLLQGFLQPMLAQGIDQLALGCTHYPFLRPLIEQVVGPAVAVIDPAAAVARQTARLFASPQATQLPAHRFYTSGDIDAFGPVLARLLPAETVEMAQIGGVTWRAGRLGLE